MRRVLLWLVVGAAQLPLLATSGFSVGYRIFTIQYSLPDGSSKPLTFSVWYPSTDPPQKHVYELNLSGSVAVDGALYKPAPWPLVVFSHGLCAYQSAALNQSVAAAGFIVAAPQHEDDRTHCPLFDVNRVDFSQYPDRPRDMSAVIDAMLSMNSDPASDFNGAVDATKIVASGYSLGGWTAAAVAGGVPDVKDARISTVLLWSPPARQDASFYQQTQAPLMYLFAEADNSYLTPYRTFPYDNSRAPKYLGYIRNAGHFVFSDQVCAAYQTVENCVKAQPGVAEALKYSVAFLKRYEDGDLASGSIVDGGDAGMVLYESQP